MKKYTIRESRRIYNLRRVYKHCFVRFKIFSYSKGRYIDRIGIILHNPKHNNKNNMIFEVYSKNKDYITLVFNSADESWYMIKDPIDKPSITPILLEPEFYSKPL